MEARRGEPRLEAGAQLVRLPSDDDAEHADDAADVEAEPMDEDTRLEGRRWLEGGGLARHRAEGPAHVVDFGVCVREVGKLAVEGSGSGQRSFACVS